MNWFKSHKELRRKIESLEEENRLLRNLKSKDEWLRSEPEMIISLCGSLRTFPEVEKVEFRNIKIERYVGTRS